MSYSVNEAIGEFCRLDLSDTFDQLQKKLPRMWGDIGSGDPGGRVQAPHTVVVIPSLTVDMEIPTVDQQAYEERFLFMLFLLGQPHLRMVYITSMAIKPEIINYYLDLVPGATLDHARKRLFLVSPEDGSSRPLSHKLLQRPSLIQQIRDLIADNENAHMVPFNTTDLEREVALQLGIPMYAADPNFYAFGTKSGARQLFAEEGINHPLGEEDLKNEAALIAAVAALRARKPQMQQMIAKLNEGVAGLGNAVIDLSSLPEPGAAQEEEAIAGCLRHMLFEAAAATYEAYMDAWQESGGIVEELVSGTEVHSPSVQLRNTPLGEVELLSTHDQLLGGPSGQSFLGASFPANPQYARLITREALKIGQRLAREGVIGRYAVDFLVVRDHPDEAWRPYAIEINLRKGGTTTPYLTLQYLTRGAYDAEAGEFFTLHGQKKYYVANDHLRDERFRAFTPETLFDLLTRQRLHFDHSSQVGIVPHMISCIGTNGSVGLTAIADTPAAAQALYERFGAVLAEEAARHWLASQLGDASAE
jgi:hypothetical protein